MGMDSAYNAALMTLERGGTVVYPTETLYALGCSGFSEAGCAAVARIKNRPQTKPLPLIIGAVEQLRMVTDSPSEDVLHLARQFWPGPLSILVPATAGLARQVKDERGMTSVRVTPHPLAARLCLDAGAPLVATSANVSGLDPAGRFADLDPKLVEQAGEALGMGPEPAGGEPSTVVEPLGSGLLFVFRRGAVSDEKLNQAGFSIKAG